MAVTYRSSGTIVAGGGAGIDMSSSLPSGLAIDDIMIFVGMDADNEHFDAAMPSGWTVIQSDNASNNMGFTVAWKRYDGTEVDWQFDTPSNSGQLVCGVIHAFSGAITSGTPYEDIQTLGPSNTTGLLNNNVTGATGMLKVEARLIEDNVAVTDLNDPDWTVIDNQTTTQGSDGRLLLSSSSQVANSDAQHTTGSNEYNAFVSFRLIPETNRPTIVPNTADAHDFGADDTPTLEFTGSDANDDDLEYEFEILSAIDTDVDKYVESNQNGTTPLPVDASTQIARGQSFTGNGDYLTEAKFYIKKTASSTGIAYAKLYEHSGTFGTNSVPTGNPLAVSQSFDISILTTSFVITSFVFDGTYQMINTTKYVIVLEFHPDNGDQIEFGIDTSSPTHGGNSSLLDVTWSSLTFDLIFYVLGNTRELNKLSVTPDATFTNTTDGGDAHPFDQPDKIDYTVQAGDALADGTWYWRARAKDPTGTNQWSDWTTIRSFDIGGGGAMEAAIIGLATITGILTAKGSLSGVIWSSYFENLVITGGFQAFGDFAGSHISYGERFDNFNNIVESFSIKIKKTGSPVFDIKAEIYSISGGIPGSLLKTSNETITAASISTSEEFKLFTFDNTVYNQDVGIVITTTNHTSSDGSNKIEIRSTNRAEFGYGVRLNRQFTGSTWGVAQFQDSLFKLQLNSVFGDLTEKAPDPIVGLISGLATTAGILTAKGDLVSSINPIAVVNGILIGRGALISAINGLAVTSGILTAKGSLTGIIQSRYHFKDQTIHDGNTNNFYDGSSTRSGQKFINFKGAIIKMAFWLKKDNSPDHDIIAEIYSISGGIPNTVLQTSTTTLAATSVTASYAFYEFAFDGVTEYDQDIAISFKIENFITSNSSNFISMDNAFNYIPNENLVRFGSGSFWISASNSEAPYQLIVRSGTIGVLTGKGTLIGPINALAITQGILIGIGNLLGTANGVATLTGVLTDQGGNELEGIINGAATVTGVLTAKGALVGVININPTINGILLGLGALIGASNGSVTITGLLTGDGKLVGIINAAGSTQGLLTGNGLLAGAINGLATTQGILIGKGALLGIANGISTVQGILTTDQLIGAINASATVQGTLTGKGDLIGVINGIATVSGVLSSDQLIGIINGIATTQGTLTAKGKLESIVNAIATVQGILIGQGLLVGASNGVSTITGVLSAIGQLEGIINGLATLTGDLTTDQLLGTIDGIATVSGILTAKGKLEAVINGIATVTGNLTDFATGEMEAAIIGIASVTGTLTGKGALIGETLDAGATVQGLLEQSMELAGIINGIAVVTGILSAGSDTLKAASNSYSVATGTLTGKGKLEGIINALAIIQGVLNTDDNSMFGLAQGRATISGNLGYRFAMEGISEGLATVMGTLRDHTDLIYGVIGGSTIINGTLTAIGKLEGSIYGRAWVAGLMGDIDEPRPCTYVVSYNENPKFAITYKTTQYKVDYTYTKYVVTFNCQKITICQD